MKEKEHRYEIFDRVRVIGDGTEDFSERTGWDIGEVLEVRYDDGDEYISCKRRWGYGVHGIKRTYVEPVVRGQSTIFPLASIREGYMLTGNSFWDFSTIVAAGKNGELGFLVPGKWFSLKEFDPETLACRGDDDKLIAHIDAIYAPVDDCDWEEWDLDLEFGEEDKATLRWNELRVPRWKRGLEDLRGLYH